MAKFERGDEIFCFSINLGDKPPYVRAEIGENPVYALEITSSGIVIEPGTELCFWQIKQETEYDGDTVVDFGFIHTTPSDVEARKERLRQWLIKEGKMLP